MPTGNMTMSEFREVLTIFLRFDNFVNIASLFFENAAILYHIKNIPAISKTTLTENFKIIKY